MRRRLRNSALTCALVCSVLSGTVATAGDFFTLAGHGGPVMAIDVANDGQIATASFDNAVGLWAGSNPHWLDGHEAAVNTVLFAENGDVFSGSDDFSIRRWSKSKGQTAVYHGHRGKVVGLALSPDGSVLASAAWDGTIGIWDLASGEGQFLKGHSGPVNDVVFTSSGDQLYSASADGTIRIWDLATRTEHQRVVEHGFGVNKVVLNEENGWLAYGAVDGGTRSLTLDTGEQIADLTLDRRPILAMELSRDGATLAVGDGEGYIMVVDARTWRITRDFRATQRGPVWALAFSPDGTNIHAGGLDTRMYSWPIDAMGELDPMQTGNESFLEDPKTLPNGERQFKRKCSICHTLSEGSARRAGPSLYGLFGRRAGTVADYTYSTALDGSDIIWQDETIDALFDIGPEHYIPGTKMPMQRITKPQDRADLIAYLRDNTK